MVIGIDARMLGPQCGGLGRYVEQLVLHLHQIDHENQYVLFLKEENWEYVSIENEQKAYTADQYYPAAGRKKRGVLLRHGNFRKVLANVPWYGWAEQWKMPRIIKNEHIDLMHFPHWNVPLLYNDPFVVTIHDLLLMHYPTREASMLGPISYWVKHRAYKKVLHHAARRARRIIVPSEYTKRDVQTMLRVPLERMSVTYEAPFSAAQEAGTLPDSAQVLEKYGITKPYALYVGVAFPHKNLTGLLQSWHSMEEKHGKNYELVFVGKDNFFYKKLKAHHHLHHGTASAIFTGFVPDEELQVLYAHARTYVFPSLYEGFGLPPLEAMRHNVPVVSSNRTCLPEILGEGALYADPENVEQFAEAMYQGLTNEDIRYELKERAKSELKRYSWEQMARQTLDIYTSSFLRK